MSEDADFEPTNEASGYREWTCPICSFRLAAYSEATMQLRQEMHSHAMHKDPIYIKDGKVYELPPRTTDPNVLILTDSDRALLKLARIKGD
jgi:hypothetical protein